MPYSIKFSHGTTERAETYEEALDIVQQVFPDAYIGHDGDLSDGGDRTLCWRDEESSEDDDGARAIASIYPLQPAER